MPSAARWRTAGSLEGREQSPDPAQAGASSETGLLLSHASGIILILLKAFQIVSHVKNDQTVSEQPLI